MSEQQQRWVEVDLTGAKRPAWAGGPEKLDAMRYRLNRRNYLRDDQIVTVVTNRYGIPESQVRVHHGRMPEESGL